jgi:hypothetical protein
VIDAAAKNLRQYYAYRDVGQKMADSLLAHEKTAMTTLWLTAQHLQIY